MDKIQIYKELQDNVQKIENVENEISMLQLAIYKKTIEGLKNDKIQEAREYFAQNLNFYNQKSEKYEIEIEKNINKYKKEIEKIINIYDNFMVNIFRIMQNAMNNQKIAIANIVTLLENNVDEYTNKNTIIACAQKKLNYELIIIECKARIKWCIQNVQTDIKDICKSLMNQVQIYKKNIIIAIKRKILNRIYGKVKFKNILENYRNSYLKDIEYKSNYKILDIAYILNGFTKQMQKVKEEISVQYEQKILI